MSCTVCLPLLFPSRVPQVDDWYLGFIGQMMDDDALLHKILIGDLFHATLWLVCITLCGVLWSKMLFDQCELAFQVK